MARTVLVVLAVLQAWAFRHVVSPDGVAYLDLSDAVVNGDFRDLVNAYWSPLYPVAIAVARLVVAPTPLSAPYWEFALVHVVNVVAFMLALVSFEWFVRAVQAASIAWAQPALTSVHALALAYGLFGAAMLVMVSIAGTGPDLFLAAAIFASCACLLRLQLDATDRRTAIRLGIVMAAGALTKSIMFPLAVIMLIALAIMTARRALRASLIAATVFVVVTLPWCLALSSALGRPSTGETGALNWAWYVNHQQPPNTGALPRLARTRDPLPLEGVAILRDARGTNPLWYDPSHWHRDVRPRFDLRQMSAQIAANAVYFLGILAPLALVAVSLAAASKLPDLQTTLARSFVVLVPSLAAVGAYAMTYATARYIAPFLVTTALILAAAFPGNASLHRGRLVLGAALMLLLIDALSPLRGRVLVAYAVTVFAVAWAVWNGERGAVRRRLLFTAITAALALWALLELPGNVVRLLTLGTGAATWYWFARRDVMPPPLLGTSQGVRVFAIAGVVGFLITTVLTGGHAVLRLDGGDVHPYWTAARRVVDAGVPEGSKIAVLGNPENSGWARLARYQIVAIIPDAQAEAFTRLTPADRQRLMTAFAQVGATQLIRATP